MAGDVQGAENVADSFQSVVKNSDGRCGVLLLLYANDTREYLLRLLHCLLNFC